MLRRTSAGWILSSLFFGGCSAVVHEPPRVLEVEPPPTWSVELGSEGGEGEHPASRWWESFGADQLNELVDEALEGNYDLQGAAHRLRQAEARARISGADLSPQVGAGFDVSRARRNFIGFPIPGGGESVLSTSSSSLGVSLNISWEADLWGRLRAGRNAALLDREAAGWELAAARLSLAGQTSKAWFAWVEARQQVHLAEVTSKSRRESRERIQRRYEAGLRGAVDLRLAAANEATAKANLAGRKRQEDSARRQLEVLLGRYPGGELDGSLALPESPGPVRPGLPSELITRRPDLKAADRRLAGADQRVAAARASLYPALRLTGSLGRSSEELGDLLSGDFSVWSLASGLLQPIFQGGRLRAGVDLAASTADEALARYAQSALRAFSEVETALGGEEFLRQQEQALELAARQAVAAQATAERRYNSGLTDYLEVLEAQRLAFQSESQLLEVRRLQLSNRVDLFLALGGGFDSPPTDPEDPS